MQIISFNTSVEVAFYTILSGWVIIVVLTAVRCAYKCYNALEHGSILTDIILADGLTVHPPDVLTQPGRGRVISRGEAPSYYGNIDSSISNAAAESDGNESAQNEGRAAAAAAATALASTAGVSVEDGVEFRGPPHVGGHGRRDAAALVGASMVDTRQRTTVSAAPPPTTAAAAPTTCLLYTSPSPRDLSTSRMPSSA